MPHDFSARQSVTVPVGILTHLLSSMCQEAAIKDAERVKEDIEQGRDPRLSLGLGDQLGKVVGWLWLEQHFDPLWWFLADLMGEYRRAVSNDGGHYIPTLPDLLSSPFRNYLTFFLDRTEIDELTRQALVEVPVRYDSTDPTALFRS